jgi:hypothetical protein
MGQVVQTNGDYEIRTGLGNDILLNTGPNIGNVRVTGNLIVTGDTLTVSAENLNVQDNIIVLNFGETGNGVSLDYAGVQIDRGTAPPTSIVYDEITDAWQFAYGTPESGFNFEGSTIRVQSIRTSSTAVLPTTNRPGDLQLIGFGTGVVTVEGTNNYASRVTRPDDIPNKKYVDDAIQLNPAFQITRDDTRIIVFDAQFPLAGGVFPIGPYLESPVTSEAAVIINNRRVARFTEEGFELRGLAIFPEDNKGTDIFGGTISEAITIQAFETNSGIRLETNGTGKVEITYAMQFDPVDVGLAPAVVTDTTVVYNGPIAGGTSGLYVVNNNYRDEFVLRNRALLFSMIF